MPIKDKKRVKEYQRLWIAKKRQEFKTKNVEPKKPVEPDKSKYYQANSIKVLISLNKYTELNRAKYKLWTNFALTFQDLQDQGIHDIIEIMKLKEVAEILIKDYWKTAKSEAKNLTNSWNYLDQEHQERLINYWTKEKVRKDNNLLTDLEKQEQEAKSYQRAIELAKFHEERGKLKCNCYDCSTKKELKNQAKAKQKKYFAENKEQEKEQCPDCERWVKTLDEETSVCRKCLQNYE